MKASILTFSQTGNTLKTGNAIATGLINSGIKTEHARLSKKEKWFPGDADIIGIGSPVFENRPSEVILEYLGNTELDFTGKKAFVFITSGGTPAKSLWYLSQALRMKGAEVLGGIQLRGACTYPTLFGMYKGRPDSKDLKEAEDFGRAFAGSALRDEQLPDHFKINREDGGILFDNIGPCLNYLKKVTTPLPSCDPSKCNLCGICLRECPTGSVLIKKKKVSFQKGCIVCYRCWHVCPQNAIWIKMSPASGLIERVIYSEKMERAFGNTKPEEYSGPNLYRDVLKRRIKLKYDEKNPTAEFARHKS